ncbi:MAG: hypothetical protein FJ294_00250 [Planctomycetes bacterium]|nr:hypothetical protein [Planctomycetota bacterium]
MNIQPNSPDGQNPALRFDPTRKARDIVEPSASGTPDSSADPKADAARVKEARDAFRERRQERLGNLRKNHTANHPELAGQSAVFEAREEHRAKLDARREATQASPDSDRIEISSKSETLARAVEARLAQGEEDRAARVAELRALYLEGKLNDPERIERAARRMLGGN